MNKDEKELERLSDKFLQDLAHEKPALDFSSKVMLQVEALETREVDSSYFQYKPLISKSGWWAIFITVFAGIFAIVYHYTGMGKRDVLSNITDEFITKLDSINFPELPDLPQWIAPIMITATILLAVDLIFIKHLFNKKFNL